MGNEGQFPLLSILIFPWDILVPSSIFLNSVQSLPYASLECKGGAPLLTALLAEKFCFLTFQRSYVEMPLVVPSREPGVSGNFWGSQEGCKGPFRPSGWNRGLPLRRRRGQGPHLAKRWEPRGFLELWRPGVTWNATPRSLPSLERNIRSRTHA